MYCFCLFLIVKIKTEIIYFKRKELHVIEELFFTVSFEHLMSWFYREQNVHKKN